jgi:LPXTG-motif cell wall-anchored protein
MQNETLFIALLIAPWVLVVAAIIFYRRRRKRKALDGTGSGKDRGAR